MSIKTLAKKALNSYPAGLLREEYESQKFTRHNERPVELNFVFRAISRLWPRTILDIGSGTTALPALMRTCNAIVTATDNVTDYWKNGMVNRHYHVLDDDIRDTQLSGSWDLVTCVSTLEHIVNAEAAVRNMAKLTKPGGHLLVSFPYNERKYCPNCYDLLDSAYGQDADYVTQSFSRKQIDEWCKDNSLEVVEQEYWQFWDGELWTQGSQIIPPILSSGLQPHQLTCVLLRKRT